MIHLIFSLDLSLSLSLPLRDPEADVKIQIPYSCGIQYTILPSDDYDYDIIEPTSSAGFHLLHHWFVTFPLL